MPLSSSSPAVFLFKLSRSDSFRGRFGRQTSQQFLDFGHSFAWIQSLRTSLGAVHDRVAAEDGERIPQTIQPLLGEFVSRIDHPTVSLSKDKDKECIDSSHKYPFDWEEREREDKYLQQDGRTEILVTVPPVGRARSAAASAQNTLVETILEWFANNWTRSS